MLSRRTFLAALCAPALAQAMPRQSAVPTDVIPVLRWARVGADPYVGTVEDALQRFRAVFTDDAIAQFRAMITMGAPTARAVITRDAITSPGLLIKPGIAMMHSGLRTLAMRVDRSMWPAERAEPAMVYALPGLTLAIMSPDACGNWCIVELVSPIIAGGPAPRRSLVDVIRNGRTPPEMRHLPPQQAPLDPAMGTGGAFAEDARRAIAGEPVRPIAVPPRDSGGFAVQQVPAVPQGEIFEVPEPSTLWLLGAAGAIGWVLRK